MAIAAPTPVSALVHSSTLVTAGVYLMIRFFEALRVYKGVIVGFTVVSRLTIVLAGLAAILERDFKKVVAYSTLRQLGVMILALGLGRPFLSFFHLSCHAIFKALMFISVGGFIHYHKHIQDLRVMGSLGFCFPFGQVGVLISRLALCGFPFIAGFYSKDPIFELSASSAQSVLVIMLIVFGLSLTRVYSIRGVMICFFRPNNQFCLLNFHRERLFFFLPLIFLSSISIFLGAFLN